MAVQSLELQISDNAEKAAQHVARLASELNRLNAAIRPGSIGALASRIRQISDQTSTGAMGRIAESISAATVQMERFTGSIENAVSMMAGLRGGAGNDTFRDVAENARQAADIMGGIAQGSLGGTVNLDSAVESAQEFAGAINDTNSEMVTLASETQSAGAATGAAASAQDEFAGAASGAGDAAGEESGALATLRDTIDGVRDRLGGLFNAFARIVRFRIFRTIIRAISTAFKEGMENVREYSKAINGLYAKDMANFDNAVLKMKNSLGASLAVAFQALLPIIHQFIDWIIEAANAINQFVALLSGHNTWTRAVDVVASDFEKTNKSASGASKAVKNLLADWDELNIIKSKNNGGGGSGTKLTPEDYKKMFEESYKFDGWIRDTVDFMESHLPIVNGLLAGIAGYLIGIRNIGVITLAIGLVTTIDNASDIAKNGFTEENLLTAATGAIEMALAGGILGFSAAGATGAMIGAITGFAVSTAITLLADFKFHMEKGQIGDAIADGIGITTMGAIAGAVIGLATGHPVIGAIAGGAVGVVVTLITAFQVDKESRNKYITVTEKELQDTVATKMFKSDVRVTLRLINTAVKDADEARQAIADDIGSMSIPLNGLELGINKQENYEKIKDEIFGTGGLIEDVQRYAKSHQTLIETNMALMPSFTANGMDSTELLMFGQEGWTTILTDFNGIGEKLSAELSKGFVDGIAQFDEEAVKAMTTEMAELAAAMAMQTTISTATTQLQMNLTSGEMTVAQAMQQYERDLESGLELAQYQMAAGNESRAAYYETKAKFHPEEASLWLDRAKEERALAQEIRKGAKEQAHTGAMQQLTPAYEIAQMSAQIKRDSEGNVIIPGAPKGYDKNGMVTPGTYETWRNKFLTQLYGAEDVGIFKDMGLDLDALLPDEVKERFGLAVVQAVERNLITGDNIPAWVSSASGVTGGVEYSTPQEPAENPQIDETNTRLGRIETSLTALRQKEWNVYIAPSTALGRATTESIRMWERSRGAVYQIQSME